MANTKAQYEWEFPDFDYKLIVPNGWNDRSWHNDTCPHIEKEVGNRGAEIWQDYADVSKREFDSSKQFILYLTPDNSDGDDVANMFLNTWSSTYFSAEFVEESDDFYYLLEKAERFLRGEEK